jgi:F-type H+-transporting ATPase subunit gamma
MASLKETKNRILSVQSTLKITSAMKLISSAKFHQAQIAVKKVLNYDQNIVQLVNSIFEGRGNMEFVYAEERQVKRVALVSFSSDTGLCGSFNSNILKVTEQTIDKYKKEGIEVIIYPVGVKITNSMSKTNLPVRFEGSKLLEKPSFDKCKAFSSILMKQFETGEFDKVEFLFHRLKKASKQVLVDETVLPYIPPKHKNIEPQDLLTEPAPLPFLQSIFPQFIATKVYTAISESLVSEHAARMTAMQIATDNANDLLKDLTILYNKTRQQAITSEILDLVGGRIRRG